MGATKIEWTGKGGKTWNPVTGCTPVSPGCANCYAARMAKRLKAMGQAKYRNEFQVTCHPDALDEPSHWRKSCRVFVCSMGDLFHEDVPDKFIEDVFNVIGANPQHVFQVLTKRPERMRAYMRTGRWTFCHHLWLGVSVEDQQRADERIPLLLDTPAAVRFLSIEPMLGPIDLDGRSDPRHPNSQAWDYLNKVTGHVHTVPDWIIVGGESGPGARPMHLGWVRSIRDQCVAAGVPFFFKQWGGTNKKAAGRHIYGRTWDEMPDGQGG